MTAYFSYVTNIGINKIEAAYNAGETINLIEMAIGDSNGAYVEPDASFTNLVNEFARVALNDASTDGHLIHVISYIKPTAETAEKTLREYGIYDDEGDMIIYGAYPESLIPSLDSAEYLQLEVENITELENADVVNVTVSPIVPYATEAEAGIAKIVKEEDVEVGTDDTKILTIFKMLKRTASTIRAGVVQLSNKTDGTSETLAATEKAVGEAMAKADAAQDALDDFKAEDNPFPQYLHNDEHATQAQAEEGISEGVWMSPLRTRQSFTAWLSQLVNGTSQTTGASEYALGLVNTKAENAQSAADSAQNALDAFKAEDNPFPQYLHNDEHATQAQAEEGTNAGVWMSPLRTAQHFLSKLSDKIDGASHELAASEYALGLVNAKTQEALDEQLHWVKVASGSCSLPWKNSTSGALVGTIETGYPATSRKHYSGRFKVNIISGGDASSADPNNCWWAFRGEPREATFWNGTAGTNQVMIDVFGYGANLQNGTGATSWELWELQSDSTAKTTEPEQHTEPLLVYNHTTGIFTLIASGNDDDIPQGSVLIDDDEAMRIQEKKKVLS
ncbi:phage tail protein [Vibrio parahaemolyticus]|nr:phage tail protein [Vibrio parahaemolyticus]